jgi:Raf kinase inhibitor-like YbhB/YbcL family protein
MSMKFAAGLMLVAGAMFAGAGTAQQGAVAPVAAVSAIAIPMTMTLPGFADGSTIPTKYTCVAGAAVVSPEVRWSNAPAGTQSFVLVFHDLEPRPMKGVMDNSHWVLWNIPATSTGLPEGVAAGAALPDGTHQMKRPRTIPGSVYSYYGPCAPKGPNHHYVFELYALDSTLNLPEDATRAEIVKASDGHVLAAAGWFGMFHQ